MRWYGPDALAVFRPTGVYLLDFYYSGIQFYLLLSPYLCFISFLYLDLYVLGDDALIIQGSSCKPNIYVLWSTSELRVGMAPWNQFKPSSEIFYWPFRYIFSGSLCFFCRVFVMPLSASVYLCLVVTCWERADLLALICGVKLWVCHFPFGILGQVWYLIVSIPDLCTLTYFT